MDEGTAKFRLESALRKLQGCESHVHQAFRDWREAQASRGDNNLYYRLRRRHGDDYMKIFENAKNSALKEFDDAKKELEQAQADYDKVKKD